MTLANSLRGFKGSLQSKTPELFGTLGVEIDGRPLVNVPTRNGYVYVKVFDNPSELIQAKNTKVPAVYGTSVLLAFDGVSYTVTGLDTKVIGDFGSHSAFPPNHAPQHMLTEGGGADPIFLDSRQFVPFSVMPTGTWGADSLYINQCTYMRSDGSFHSFGGTGTPSLLGYAPSDDTAVMLLIYCDTNTGNPGYILGDTYFSTEITDAADVVQYLPNLTGTATNLPLGALRLVSGTSSYVWQNVYDVRQFYGDNGALKNPVDYVDFDMSYTGTTQAGRVQWNSDEETYDFGLSDGVVGQSFRELLFWGKNATGSIIPDGTPVMFAAPVGASGKSEIQLAIADGSIPSEYIMGITTQAIGIGEFGNITWVGNVRGIDTTGTPYGEVWSDGDLIFVSPTTAGDLTNVEPNAPTQRILVASVQLAHTNGTLLVRPTWSPKLSGLDDVDGSAPSVTGHVLSWNQSTGVWERAAYNINDYLTTGDAATTYLKLDASNDPLTAGLGIVGSADEVQLFATLNSTQTVNGFEIRKSDNTVLAGADERGILFSDGGTDETNLYIGKNAGKISSGSTNNIGLGYFALSKITTGDNNSSIGYYAGANITTGSGNMCIGYGALQTLIGGANNIAVGTFSLSKVSSGGSNTAIGGSCAVKYTGTGGIFLGTYSGGQQTNTNYVLIVDSIFRASEAAEQTDSIIYGVMAATPAAQILRINAALHLPERTTPTAITNYGAIYPKADNRLYFQDGAGTEHVVHGFPSFKSYNVTTQGLGANPDVYAAGYLEFSATDANLTQASTTVTIGTANISYAAHAFIVAGGAGTTDGSDLVLTVTGISINDDGTRNASDSEVIVADCTASALNQHYETSKKWLGQITFTLSSTGGATFSYDFNYGLSKYEDFSNEDFVVEAIEVVGLAGANDTDFDIKLMHYDSTWVYAATGFDAIVAGNTIVSLAVDHSTDNQLLSGKPFAWKRANLSTAVAGSASEGIIIRVESSANNAVEYCNIHVGVSF